MTYLFFYLYFTFSTSKSPCGEQKLCLPVFQIIIYPSLPENLTSNAMLSIHSTLTQGVSIETLTLVSKKTVSVVTLSSQDQGQILKVMCATFF